MNKKCHYFKNNISINFLNVESRLVHCIHIFIFIHFFLFQKEYIIGARNDIIFCLTNFLDYQDFTEVNKIGIKEEYEKLFGLPCKNSIKRSKSEICVFN
jgi:hypothetical protein